MAAQWADGGAARSALMQDETAGLSSTLTGMGSLSYGETAGERMRTGLMLNDPEEEHSCFADNTHNDHFYNGVGIRNVYLGEYVRTDGATVSGPSVSDLVAAENPELDQKCAPVFRMQCWRLVASRRRQRQGLPMTRCLLAAMRAARRLSWAASTA